MGWWPRRSHVSLLVFLLVGCSAVGTLYRIVHQNSTGPERFADSDLGFLSDWTATGNGRRSVRNGDPNACDVSTSRVRVQANSSRREFCHGTAHFPVAVATECVRIPEAGSAIPLNDRTSLYEHPLGRFFEIIPGAIVSARRGSLQRGGRAEGITIAVHSTIDTLVPRLTRLASMWRGFISIAVLSDDPDRDGHTLRDLARKNEGVREWVDFHFVRRKGHSTKDPSAFYPINLLRNVATRQAPSKWVMVLDMTVLPSACMDAFVEQVRAAEARVASAQSACPGLVAFIPPAVEANNIQSDVAAGCTFFKKATVGASLRSGLLQPARPRLPLAHMPTNYTAWVATDTAYEVDYVPQFAPFFIARAGLPWFNDSFFDSDRALAQQILHMAASGYRFVVLPSVFLVDIPTPPVSAQPGVEQLWRNFVGHVSGLYGISVAYDRFFGQQFVATRSLYAREIGKYPLLSQQGGQATVGKEPSQQYALVMLTYMRNDLLREILTYYCGLPSLWGVIVVWNNVGVPVPDAGTIAPSCKRPVHIVPQKANRITNRYLLTNIPSDAPDAMFILDDDLLFEDAAVELAFEQWLAHPNQIVGFIPRVAVPVADRWEYGVQDKVEKLHQYHFILLGASIIHRRHFETYWRLPETVLTHVETVRNCDDLAMNFAVARDTSLPPLWVDAQYSRRSATGQFQENNNHFSVRSDCITRFIRTLGEDALVPGKSVILPVGRKFQRLMPHVN